MRLYIEAPCGCVQCESCVQAGHFACEATPAHMKELEARGCVQRTYEGRWRWVVVGTMPNLPARIIFSDEEECVIAIDGAAR